MIPSIPTLYKGILFRSRLEATWAAFFDQLGWSWEYEPSLDLNGWIPDFALFSNKTRQITLVEVKPYTDPEEFNINGVVEKATNAIPFIESGDHSHTKYEVLFLGVAPFISGNVFDKASVLGWLTEKCYGVKYKKISNFDECALNHFSSFGFLSMSGSWFDRILEEGCGDSHVAIAKWEETQLLWGYAKNEVQYSFNTIKETKFRSQVQTI